MNVAREMGVYEEVVKHLTSGGEMPLRKNHEDDTLRARLQKAGTSWCMNAGDIPQIITALES